MPKPRRAKRKAPGRKVPGLNIILPPGVSRESAAAARRLGQLNLEEEAKRRAAEARAKHQQHLARIKDRARVAAMAGEEGRILAEKAAKEAEASRLQSELSRMESKVYHALLGQNYTFVVKVGGTDYRLIPKTLSTGPKKGAVIISKHSGEHIEEVTSLEEYARVMRAAARILEKK